MEILIAILWYLQVLVVGGNYSQADIHQMIQNNVQSINQVQQNQQLTNQIMNDFEKSAIDVWEDDKPEPIPN
jgi:cell division protein FtsB